MDTTSLTSNGRPTRGQIRRVRNLAWEAVEETLECKFPFTYGQLQVVHTAGGKFKAKFSVAFREFVFAFALKGSRVLHYRCCSEDWSRSTWLDGEE